MKRGIFFSVILLGGGLSASADVLPPNPAMCQESGYSAGASGNVIFRVLKADLRVREDEVSDFKYVLEQIAFIRESTGTVYAWHEDIFNMCKALSASGVPFKSERINYSPHVEKDPEWKNPTISVSTQKEFKEQCIDQMPIEEDRVRLENITNGFPHTYPYDVWREGLEKRTAACQDVLRPICKNVSEVSPFTVGMVSACKIKNLSSADLQQGLKLNPSHQKLIDTLKLCGDAKEYRYTWAYEDPALPAACLKKKTKTSPVK